MKTILAILAAAAAAFGGGLVCAVDQWRDRALRGTPEEAAAAIRDLRNLGPRGFAVLRETYRNRPKRLRVKDAPEERWRAVLDAVAKQRDSAESGLFWHTDLEEAMAAARNEGRPILSLRLLGNLDEEFSCANSRFFRTVLYANLEVSKALREGFVLHWKSLLRLVSAFERSIRADTVRNEYLFHRKIHEWLAAAPAFPLDDLNERVYAELFLTPSSDPWLGLVPPDAYTALTEYQAHHYPRQRKKFVPPDAHTPP